MKARSSTRSRTARCPPRSALAAEQIETRSRLGPRRSALPQRAARRASRRAGLVVVATDPAGGRASARAGADSAWVRNPIDAFILARLRAGGLRPAPEADRRALIRRVSFDLTGLPPSPEAVDQFVADPDPRAYEALVERLLASPHYGERWGRHWLDVVRFGESEGYETNLPRANAWPFRDYVIRAFNRDTPFPRFVLEQLAGDTLERPEVSPGERANAPDSPMGPTGSRQAATGFLVGGAHDVVGNQTVEGMLQQRADDLDDMITATGTTFLGLTIQCARCHDHKFDPITQKDYYGLQAILAGVNHAERMVAAPDSECTPAPGERARSRAGSDRIAAGCDRAARPARPGSSQLARWSTPGATSIVLRRFPRA